MAMPATLPPPSPCKERVFYEPKEYSPGLQLYWAAFARSLPDMAEALAHGAEVNWVNTEDDKRTPLMMAVQGVSAAPGGAENYTPPPQPVLRFTICGSCVLPGFFGHL